MPTSAAPTFGLSDPDLIRDTCFIAGTWRGAAAGRTFAVQNPATGDVVGHVPDCGREETRDAIDAASNACNDWRERTADERASLLHRWAQLLYAHQADLARLMTLEQGKPLAEANGEVAYAAQFIDWFAEEGKRAYGAVSYTHLTLPTSDLV